MKLAESVNTTHKATITELKEIEELIKNVRGRLMIFDTWEASQARSLLFSAGSYTEEARGWLQYGP